MALLLLLAFIIGALTVVAMEAAGLWFLIRFLNRKAERKEIKAKDVASVSSPGDLNLSLSNKQGTVWILVPDQVLKSGLEKKEIMEVTPVRKYARIRDHCLILMEPDGSCVEISLRGCTIVAVSATSLSSRKWAKRYPIKVERRDSAIYRGHKIIYIYLETSWDKESWCKALRLASCNDKEKITWFSELNAEFHSYLTSLNAGYPSFMKPYGGSNTESIDKLIKFDNSSSKVRQFLKKLTKKASKSGQDYKTSGASTSAHEETKVNQKSRSFQDLFLINDIAKVDTAGKIPGIISDDASVTSSVSSAIETGIENHLPQISDEGTLCINVLISRLFFDVKNSSQIKTLIQNRIQRALSNMRIPSYIGEVNCTAVDPGNLPPHVLAMRVLPSNMDEVWSLEIDLEYQGGMVLDFETRLEIRELELEGGETSFGMNNASEATSDLLEGFEDLGKQLKISEETPIDIKQKDEIYDGKGLKLNYLLGSFTECIVKCSTSQNNLICSFKVTSVSPIHYIVYYRELLYGYDNKDFDTLNKAENPKGTAQASSQGSRWKSMLHSISKQVSQVPLALGIKVSSLSGTMRLCMKPPPSDHIWFGFTSMPDIQFNLESFVGDHKITNGHLALFLISRFKTAIRETLVLPNSDSVGIPWMLAEKDDWVPRKAAPFMWYKNNQDSIAANSNNTTKQGIPRCFTGEATQQGGVEANTNTNASTRSLPMSNEKTKDVDSCIPEAMGEYSDACASSSSSMDEATFNENCSQEIRAPLLNKDKSQEFGMTDDNKPDKHLHSPSQIFVEGQTHNSDDEESRMRRIGTRERMRGLGKKMGEKLVVKRRHLEERGRSFVERMRGPS
ncbi:testis-expressed sequence 2 protein [Striga asiatica]|uniref:Testis-expressed sequence 2 protein n=1 Tax=Striga asiatica TaxID=4170 RepID=A0A5A7PZT6_STRAF|nr:testis-expressed sequence 2 protein [Striga asiatica]